MINTQVMTMDKPTEIYSVEMLNKIIECILSALTQFDCGNCPGTVEKLSKSDWLLLGCDKCPLSAPHDELEYPVVHYIAQCWKKFYSKAILEDSDGK